MSPLEIISRLCDVTETLSAIVKKQQTIIEQSKNLQSFSESVPSREMRKRTHRKMQNREQQPTQW